MDLEQLLKYLDIADGSEFEYFEDFENLIENEEEIDNDVIFELFKEVNMDVLKETSSYYFNDVMEFVPGEQIDLYNLLENIRRVLAGLITAVKDGEENALLKLADEFNRFRNWYSVEKTVECRNLDDDSITQETLRDALVNARIEKLEGEEYDYDFTKTLQYELEEYIMTYADMDDEDMDVNMIEETPGEA